jgi:hypothetical protein
MDWRCDSGSVPALQMQSPEFKPQSHKKKKNDELLPDQPHLSCSGVLWFGASVFSTPIPEFLTLHIGRDAEKWPQAWTSVYLSFS